MPVGRSPCGNSRQRPYFPRRLRSLRPCAAKPGFRKFGLGAAPDEWTALTDHLTEAGFTLDELSAAGLTVAFFSISSKGNVIVRATDDYIPRMIELAGGTYVFQDLFNESGNNASVRLSMEDFYQTAKDADYLIYNATIENPVRSISELCGRSALLTDFKAVQNGNVWQVERSLYQSPDIAAQMITDLHRMLTGENTSGMVFLKQLD